MSATLFYVFSAIMLLFGIGVVVNRNPVSSALCLVMSFVGLAALCIQLDAFLIGVVQVLVYAGAVMVLFLFIIMLLDLKAEQRRKLNGPAVAGGLLVTAAFAAVLVSVLGAAPRQAFPALDTAGAAAARTAAAAGREPAASDAALRALENGRLPDVHLLGEALFTRFLYPLQVVGVLLLVATVGVVFLSKRRLT